MLSQVALPPLCLTLLCTNGTFFVRRKTPFKPPLFLPPMKNAGS